MTTINEYDIGDLVKVTATFTDDSGVVTDPATVEVSYKTPAGVITTLTYGTDPEVTKESTGVYTLEISITETGRYDYRWFSTGIGQAAEEGYFLVRKQQVA